MREPDVEDVLQEINGCTRRRRHARCRASRELKADGSTACGCWIYSGVFPTPGRNRANEREPHGRYGHGWGFAWPRDRRILYNRASARPDGTPWSERKKLVWWDAAQAGVDRATTSPTSRRRRRPTTSRRRRRGRRSAPGDAPFIMHPDGLGWIWVPIGLKDGPLPTHYEPLESPVANPLYPGAARPIRRRTRWSAATIATRRRRDPRFPLRADDLSPDRASHRRRDVAARSRISPSCSRSSSPRSRRSWPRELGVAHGGWVTISTPRGVDRSARARDHRACRPLRRRRPARAPGRPAVSLGLSRARHRRLATTSSPCRRSRTSASWKRRHWSATSAPGGDPRRRAALEYLDALMRGEPLPTSGSSPTRRSASAARRARWPARNGTRCRTTASVERALVRQHHPPRPLDWRHVKFVETAPRRASAATPARCSRGSSSRMSNTCNGRSR